MKRYNSLQNCRLNIDNSLLLNSKSLPNIEILVEEVGKKSDHGVKRHNSKKVKILQKTWDKVKTIIHPSGRRSSRAKQSPSEAAESPRNSSPLLAKYFRSSPSGSTPSTPNKKLEFDFDPIGPPKRIPDYNQRPNGPPGQQSFDDPEEDQVVKNYVELQKRLSDELHQAMKDDKRKDEGLSEEFKKRLQQWEMWKASTGRYHYTEEELQKLLPLEFSKKLQEWEDIKSRPREEGLSSSGIGQNGLASAKSDRKKKKTDESHRQKELAWLEKQLEKIESEKKRLEKEMVKYCEREVRLQKMREALRNNPDPKQEVWIKTPTAECKVEGINEKFTKKLYKWEEKKGIQPEASTMALLNPKYFATTPEPHSPVETIPPPFEEDQDVVNPERLSKDFGSHSEDSEADEEYEEATDSFATKDEPASGASNTDSDCFNLKPGFRRRSSDAISTPLSARSPSPSCCTSDDDENLMLQTVNENEEEKLLADEKPAVVKAKPIVLRDDGEQDSSFVIVKTQRTIFAPVEAEALEDGKDFFAGKQSLASPTLVKNISKKMNAEVAKEKPVEKEPPPRIVGGIRKDSSYQAATTSKFSLPPIPSAQQRNSIKDGSKPMLGKIPVWCSPLMARRRFLESQTPTPPTQKFSPQSEFSLDNFLESNLIPIPPPRPSRIPINSSPGSSRRKYTVSSSGSSGGVISQEHESVRLVSLIRSRSFQGPNNRTTGAEFHGPRVMELAHPVQVTEKRPPEHAILPAAPKQEASVTKSKSTGSILGNTSGTKGLFGFASKLVHNKSGAEVKQKRQIIPSWLKTPSSPNNS